MRMLIPAKSHKAATLKRIAVLPFSGRGGDEVADEITAMLVGIHINDKPYFTVIERSAIDRIRQEQRLQLSGEVDEDTATELGKLLGAEGLIIGKVSSSTNDKSYRENRTKCSYRNKEGKCTSWTKYTVSCTKRKAFFSFSPKIIEIADGNIVASEFFSAESHDSVCSDSQRALDSRQKLINEAKSKVVPRFRYIVAPYYVTIVVKLLKSDNTKIPDNAQKLIDSGFEWSKNGRTDRACEFWDKASEIHKEGYLIPYLLGICAEMSGKLLEAKDFYDKADRATPSPVTEISTAINRVNHSIGEQKQLSEQMKKLEEPKPEKTIVEEPFIQVPENTQTTPTEAFPQTTQPAETPQAVIQTTQTKEIPPSINEHESDNTEEMNHNTVSNTEMNSSLKQKDLLQEKKQEKSVFNKDDEKEMVKSEISKWANAWSQKDVSTYLSIYAKSFIPPKRLSREAWEKQRHRKLNKPYIKINITNLSINFINEALADATFDQYYESGNYRDNTKKILRFIKENDAWRILEEKSLQ